MKFSQVKEKYDELREKYVLPSFDDLNNLFDVDKLNRDSQHVARDIRRIIMDKILDNLRMVEMLLNPSNAPPMFLQFIKKVSYNERILFSAVYRRLVVLELYSIELEVSAYSIENEVKFIDLAYKTWKELLPDWKMIVEVMKNNVESPAGRRQRDYFG